MPNLSTILHCKCIFFAKMLVLLNKFTTFAMCFIVKHAHKGSQLKTFATMKNEKINNFKVIESTSTRLCVEISPSIRLYGQRHSDRRSGVSVWETHFEKFAKWKVHDNPFDRKDYSIVEKWGYVKANTFRGIILAKKWSYKKDIITALNSVPTQPITNN